MSKDEYLITDAPLKALTVFAMPMILGSFFQQVYNMADSIIVGQYVGSSALAAVGACAALTNVFMYNILSTMFTSIGESKIPLGLLIFSSILNIIMDLWMVAGLGLGVFGAALATLIAQGISAVFSSLIFFYRMRQYKSPFHWFDGYLCPSAMQYRRMCPRTLVLRKSGVSKKVITLHWC